MRLDVVAGIPDVVTQGGSSDIGRAGLASASKIMHEDSEHCIGLGSGG